MYNVGYYGFSWSSSVNDRNVYYLDFNNVRVEPQTCYYRAYGFQVRCLQE